MKLIQILTLVAALAVTAAAQSTSTNSQNSGSTSPSKTNAKTDSGKSSQKGSATSQTPPVKLTVAKSSQTATSKNATSTSSTKAKSTTAAKTGAQATAAKTPVSKAPAVVVKPVHQSAAKGASTAGSKKTAAVTPKKTPPVKIVVAKKKEQVKVVPKKVADNKKPSSDAETIKSGPAGRRDPFVSIIRNAPTGPAGPSCSVGKKCLYIPELMLKGIARDPDGQMLAVVVSNTRRAYFLRENDQVFNGSVEKITSDSVVFREYATDHLGRETAHEVVKRIPKT